MKNNPKKNREQRRVVRGGSTRAKANKALVMAAFRCGFLNDTPENILGVSNRSLKTVSPKSLFMSIIASNLKNADNIDLQYNIVIKRLMEELEKDTNENVKYVLNNLGLRAFNK